MANTNSHTTDEATRVRALPGFYNNLDGSLAHAWAMIGRGVADRRSAFHTPVVATVDETGAPSQRVMVLRAADGAARTLRLHTDLRSEKLVHIGEQPRVSMAFYDASAKLQLRLGAQAHIHVQDGVADQAWLIRGRKAGSATSKPSRPARRWRLPCRSSPLTRALR